MMRRRTCFLPTMIGLILLATSLTARGADGEDASKFDTPLPGWKDLPAPATVELSLDDIVSAKGDGADGQGNTDDDTWGFWLQLAHDPNAFHRLGPHTTTLTPDQRKNGIRDPRARRGQGKVAGPIAGSLPNPDDTEGWIFGTDWDGRFEGVWGDKKAKQILLHPFVEKYFHGALAITYRIPATGSYTISGKVTDVQPFPPGPRSDGITWKVEVAEAGKSYTLLKQGGPVGDGNPQNGNSMEFKIENVKIGGGRHVRLVIHPNAWWGGDMTRIDSFKIEKAQ